MTRRMRKSAAWIVPGYNSGVSRRVYIDWARGIAVLLMIGRTRWTRGRAQPIASASRIATPLSSVGLRRRSFCGWRDSPSCWRRPAAERPDPAAAPRDGARPRRGVEVACRRGLEIFILAFLFRLQGFIVTPGGSPVTLFRVDILNIMGPAMVGVGLLWGAGRHRRRARRGRARRRCRDRDADADRARRRRLVGALAASGCSGTCGRPASSRCLRCFRGRDSCSPAARSARGSRRRPGRARERRLHSSLGAFGAVLIAFGFYTAARPSIYRVVVVLDQLADVVRDPRRHPDGRAVSVIYAMFRHGLQSDSSIGTRRAIVRWRGWAAARCSSTGSTSSWSTATRAGCGGTAAALGRGDRLCCISVPLMYGAIVLRDRRLANWRSRPRRPSARLGLQRPPRTARSNLPV